MAPAQMRSKFCYTNLHDRLYISGNLQAPICYNITLITNAAPTGMLDAGAAVSPAGRGVQQWQMTPACVISLL
jgi:hypothetical protein